MNEFIINVIKKTFFCYGKVFLILYNDIKWWVVLWLV